MIARTSALVGAISGSLGSITAKNTRTGLVLAHRPLKTNSQTTRSFDHRARFLKALRAWPTLSDAQRTAWRRLAQTLPHNNSLGISRALTGQQLFVSRMISRLLISTSILPDPPAGIQFPPPTNVVLTFQENTQYVIAADIAPGAPDSQTTLYFGRSFSQTRPAFFDNYVFVGNSFLHLGNPSFDWFPDLDAIQGEIQPFEWVFVRLQSQAQLFFPSQNVDTATQVQPD